MSNLTNDIKRVRAKLKVLEDSGSYPLLSTFLDFLKEDGYMLCSHSDKDKIDIINRYKATLQNELDELLSKQQHFSQGKLQI